MDDERRRAAVHDVAGAGGDVLALVRPWAKADAVATIDAVLGDYVTELNRVIAGSGGQPYGVDTSAFMRQYAVLWSAKLAL